MNKCHLFHLLTCSHKFPCSEMSQGRRTTGIAPSGFLGPPPPPTSSRNPSGPLPFCLHRWLAPVAPLGSFPSTEKKKIKLPQYKELKAKILLLIQLVLFPCSTVSGAEYIWGKNWLLYYNMKEILLSSCTWAHLHLTNACPLLPTPKTRTDQHPAFPVAAFIISLFYFHGCGLYHLDN